jgi:Cytochrome b5-like Heme/Steroid binding domain
MISLEDAVLDITAFLPHHPGSPETLLSYAGADITDLFNEIGHSQIARDLSKEHLVCSGWGWGSTKIYTKKQRLLLLQKKTALFMFISQSNARNRLSSFSTPTEHESSTSGKRFEHVFVEFDPSRTSCIQSGAAHKGDAKVFYDPLKRDWNGWWTCCGKKRKTHIPRFSLYLFV